MSGSPCLMEQKCGKQPIGLQTDIVTLDFPPKVSMMSKSEAQQNLKWHLKLGQHSLSSMEALMAIQVIDNSL
jgi:hypothetical protein